MSVHPYYVEKAREAMVRHDGDPQIAGLLAEWAEAHRDDRSVHGVIVAQDGEIMAETFHVQATPGSPGVTYVNDAGRQRWDLQGNEIGLALGQIKRQAGKPVVHITRSTLCTGPSSRTLDPTPRTDALLELRETVAILEDAQRARDRQIRDALAVGVPWQMISEATGLSKARIYQIRNAVVRGA